MSTIITSASLGGMIDESLRWAMMQVEEDIKRNPRDPIAWAIYRDLMADCGHENEIYICPISGMVLRAIPGRDIMAGIFPVTQMEYQKVMRVNPSEFKKVAESQKGLPSCDTGWLPVETVSWNDATAFCQKLSEMSGQEVRLMTEDEWEYCCRAGTTTDYWTGDTLTTEQANIDNSIGQTSLVGSYPPNPWGLYDTHGNVWEWTA